jgi:two-component system, chemotaxis family, CheB/CheR fusion protein
VAAPSVAQNAQLVVIGSSAGGIEALSRVVASLPADFPAPILIAQHLDPRRPSHLPEILKRHAKLPIRIVEEGVAIEAGAIYVVPSNRLVEISNGRLHVRPAKVGKVAPSVDLLLESAAKAYGAGLMAVILTGTGTDGSAGAWQVKEHGGAVVIENPATAMFPSMPQSISPSLIDATADLASIGGVIRDLVSAGSAPPQGSDQRDFNQLLERIRERSGIDLGTYKPATIVRRLRGRMSAMSQPSIAAYANLIERDPDEYARLVSDLLIKVTQFFRDPKVFEYLRERVLPDLIDVARRDGRELRLWSAGCSTGEEAYSLAIILAEALGDRPLPARIFATDVDAAAIAFARRGLYPPGAMKGIPTTLRNRYFLKTPDGFEVEKRLRGLMVFGEHDLGARAPFPRIDLVLCRNVLIYFTPPMQRGALETFAYSLREGGRLALGPSETVAAMAEPYEQEHARFRLYRRLAVSPGVPLARTATARTPISDLAQKRPDPTIQRGVEPVSVGAGSAEALLLSLGVGVVVVDAQYDTIRINSTARRILGIHGIGFDQDFVHVAESLPSTPIRESIDAALRGESTTATYAVESLEVTDDAIRSIETYVHPYLGETGAVEGAVIELVDATRFERERVIHARTTRRAERAALANLRLVRANVELTTAIGELRASNQRMLQSSQQAEAGREEVETLNEEFQATNEELETLNEELTASVEELRIANDDLAARTEELRLQALELERQKLHSEQEHVRLESILASLGDAVVAVDRNGATVATNVAYDRLFGGSDGRIEPQDLAGLPLPKDDWPQQRAARGERFRMEFAVSADDGTRQWFEAVAEPLAVEDQTWGGVLAIRDISDRTMRLSLERLMAAAGHELKTPAAAIHNYIQLVDRQLEGGHLGDAAKYSARALAQTRRLGQLIERLFDVGRIQSGQLDLTVDVVDLVGVVREAVHAAEVISGTPEIRFTAARGPIRVRGDAARLGQVFLNLLTNAIEHAPSSTTVDVTVSRVGRDAQVEVRDYGDGIAADGLPKLFQAYARLGHGRRRSGLGLGLYVAREIVTAHGGRIELSSRPGEGTTITVHLPLGRASAGDRRKPAIADRRKPTKETM